MGRLWKVGRLPIYLFVRNHVMRVISHTKWGLILSEVTFTHELQFESILLACSYLSNYNAFSKESTETYLLELTTYTLK